MKEGINKSPICGNRVKINLQFSYVVVKKGLRKFADLNINTHYYCADRNTAIHGNIDIVSAFFPIQLVLTIITKTLFEPCSENFNNEPQLNF